jgi:hypothetical protein
VVVTNSPFPPAPPTVSATNLITVSLFLNSPARVQRSIETLAYQRFIADVVFGTGPTATGGAVIYDQLADGYLFMDRDVQEIAPGAEFPLLTSSAPVPLVAIARKWGGEVLLTDEEVRRDNRNVLQRELQRLRNTIVRKVDTLAMAALRAAPTNTMAASGSWATAATDIIADLAQAVESVTQRDLGYEPDTVLLNPAQEVALLKDVDIRTALPRERTDVPVATGNLGRLLGLDFIVSNRINAGEVFVLQRGAIGGISDEVPLYTKPIPDERREVTFLHGARVTTPYVTDPLAATRITGA